MNTAEVHNGFGAVARSVIVDIGLRGATIAGVSVALTEWLVHDGFFAQARLYLLVLASLVWLLGHFLAHAANRTSEHLVPPVGNAATVAFACCLAVMAAWWIRGGAYFDAAPIVAVFIVTLLTSSLTRLLREACGSEHAAVYVGLLTLVAGATPLWMAPVIDKTDGLQPLTDFVIALSPLTLVATFLDFDYLRSEWFYTHFPFGELRYDYPSALSLTVTYLLLAGICIMAQWKRHAVSRIQSIAIQ